MCFIRIIKALLLQIVLIALISSNLYAHLAKKASPNESAFLEYLPPGDHSYDNNSTSDFGDVKLTVNKATTANIAPVANAGRDTIKHINNNYAFLFGSASDTDGNISSYSWTKVSGPSANLRDVNTATLQVVNLIVGTYVFRLTVYDNEGASGYDDVIVKIIGSTPPPIANAGNDTTIMLPKITDLTYIYIYGSGSLQGIGLEVENTLSLSWSMESGPSEIKTNSGGRIVIPKWDLMEGTYVFRLRARDRYGATAYDDMKLTVNKNTTPNVTPVANAGNDTTALLPHDYSFITGSGTDSDGIISSYSWSQVSGPSANLRDVNTPTLQVVNLVEGTYVFRLTVSDDEGASDYDEVKLTVKMGKPVNIAPVANAGKDTTALLPYDYSFITGSGSDSDGVISSYSWSKVSGPPASLQIKDAARLKVVNLVEGDYVFRLTVVDDEGASGFDDVKLTVKASPDNNAPVADAGKDTTIIRPINYCFITGSGSDSDGSILYYNWTKVSGGHANLRDVNTARLQVVNLSVGTYVFRLTVWDNEGNSSYDDMEVTVIAAPPPFVVNAGNDTIAILPYNYCFITGSATDSDGTIESYFWTKESGPNASLQNAKTLTLKVVNLLVGTYVFRLTAVNDDRQYKSDLVKLTVYSAPPGSPQTNNLVAHWRLNNNAIDDSGNGFDGTLKNGASFTTLAKEGSQALDTYNNGNYGYIELAKPKELPSGRSPRSMSVWAMSSYIDSTYNYRCIASFGKAATSSAMFIGKRGTELIAGAYGDDLISENSWPQSSGWNHIVLTYDGDTVKLYLNGILRLSEAKNWTLIPEKAYIGRQVDGNDNWIGNIDDVRIYNKALSLSEIQELADNRLLSNQRVAGEVKERATFKPDLKEINVYPNPSSGRFSIDISPQYYSSAEELSITLYDLMGSQVMNKKLPFQEERVDMDISSIKDAVYLYVISSQNGTLKRGKFIKDAGH